MSLIEKNGSIWKNGSFKKIYLFEKRAVLKKLKALEANMGIYDDYYSEEAETPAASEDSASEELDSLGFWMHHPL